MTVIINQFLTLSFLKAYLVPIAILVATIVWLTNAFRRHRSKSVAIPVITLGDERATVVKKVPEKVRSLPGPFAWPILGNALQVMDSDNYFTLTKWSKKYGPIFAFHYGSTPNVVISDRKIAKQILNTEVIGAGRTQSYAVRRAMGDCVFGTEGPIWEKLRKFEINAWKQLGSGTPELDHEIGVEVDKMLHQIQEMASKNETTDLLMPVYTAVTSFLCRFVLGETCSEEELQRMLGLNLGILGFFASPSVDLVNMFPPIRHLLPKTWGFPKLEAAADGYNDFLREKVARLRAKRAEHGLDIEKPEGDAETFVEAWYQMLGKDKDVNDDHLLAVLMEQIFPSLEITVAFTWAVRILLAHPEKLEKLTEELKRNEESGVHYEWANQDKFPYTNATILEAWRMARFSPCSFPRRAQEDCVVDGYFIPKDSRVFFLRYASTRDPTYFKDPLVFRPERFLPESMTGEKSENGSYNPYGFGRRLCPAQQLSSMIVFKLFTKLLSKFDFKVTVPQNITPESALEYVRAGFILTPYPLQVGPSVK